MHGDISKPGTVILSSSDYTKHVFGNHSFMTFLTKTLLTKSILFIGTSLNDIYVKRILEETMFITGGLSVPHFAILANIGTIEKRMLRERFNIYVISYKTTCEGDHVPAIGHILHTMLQEAAAEGR
jgi:SIR2-like domain